MIGHRNGQPLAITEVGLPRGIYRKLQRRGIVTVPMLAELLASEDQAMARILGSSTASLRGLINDAFPGILDQQNSAVARGSRFLQPVAGIPTPAEHAEARHRLPVASNESDTLIIRRLERVKPELPSSIMLDHFLPPVKDQGHHGTCVGFASTASREFGARRELSPGFAYRGAKKLDNMPTTIGSFQQFAFEFMVQVGQVVPSDYSYQDAINSHDIETLFNRAASFRMTGYVDLCLRPASFSWMPMLLKAVLTGKLSDQLGPTPISVSLRTPSAFLLNAVALDGVVPEPIPGLPKQKCGHAMTIVGYVDGTDTKGLYGRNYFVVRNSYGTAWASANPLGRAGHALIPDSYFANPDDLWEALVCVAEPSPASDNWLRKLPGRWSS